MPISTKTGIIRSHEISTIIGVSPLSVSISGWSAGVFIQFRQETPNVTHVKGASGESGINLSISNSFEIDINLLQTSSDNLSLSVLHQATIKSGTTYPFQFDDASGQTRAAGGTSLFTKFPDAGFNKDGVETWTWTLLVTHLELILGGNA